jgi:NADPH:quinone reductase-like Zn-dependent oxidoreductase
VSIASRTRVAAGREVLVSARGGPSVLAIRDAEARCPGDDEVLIEVAAAGVAFGDVMLREGLRAGVTLPAVPGYDVAGTVLAAGSRSSLAPGDTVVAWTGGTGGYATHTTVPDWAAVSCRPELDPAKAVAVVLNYLTAFQMLHRATAIGEGDRILVHGGGGGVGTAMLQLARMRGVTVYATASNAKHETLRSLGAIPIDYRTQDFVTEVRRMAPGGVTAVYDPIGGASWARSRGLLAPGGTLVGYGFATATRGGRRRLPAALLALARTPWVNMLTLVRGSTGISGFAITEIIDARHDWYRRDLATLLDLLIRGEIDPIIASRLPLDRAAEAHEQLATRPPIGKIVLEPNSHRTGE